MSTEVGKIGPFNEEVSAFLKRPYTRMIIPEEDGTFRGEILEFPGCIATGDNPDETLSALEDAAGDWLNAALINRQNIPDPVDSTEFSGKLVLRLPKSLHKKAARLAERDGVSLNQLILSSLAENIGERARPLNMVVVNTTALMGSAPYYMMPWVSGLIATATSASSSGSLPLILAPLRSASEQINKVG